MNTRRISVGLAGRGGFTLLEVLIVVVIAVSVAAFAVPAYKKAQDRNRYMAATGVLMDLGNAARMLHADYPSLSISSAKVDANQSACPDTPTSSNVVSFMQCNKYLNKIPFSGSSYMGYTFAISTTGGATCGSCRGSNAMACMSGGNRLSEYTCAWIDNGGVLHNNNG